MADNIIFGEIDSLVETVYGRRNTRYRFEDATKLLTLLLMKDIQSHKKAWEKLSFKSVLADYGYDLDTDAYEHVLMSSLQMVALLFGCSFETFPIAFSLVQDYFVDSMTEKFNSKYFLNEARQDDDAMAIYVIQRSSLVNNHYIFDAFVINYNDWHEFLNQKVIPNEKPKDIFDNSGFTRLETKALLSDLIDEDVLTYRLRPVLRLSELEHIGQMY